MLLETVGWCSRPQRLGLALLYLTLAQREGRREIEGPHIHSSRTSADSAGGFKFLWHIDDRSRATETHTVLGQQSTPHTHATGGLDESGSVRECTYD